MKARPTGLPGTAGTGSVTESEFERWCYSHDIMHIPSAVRSLFKTLPDAVVKPSSTEQVSAVLGHCRSRKIPVTARGAGSSGLFAAVPKRGGVVLDTRGLDAVIEIDVEHETVTAQAGLTWWELERALNRRGLALRSYPSSARSATLGGWVMTSGLGIGSLKFGNVFTQVVAMQMIHADGAVREYGPETGLQRLFETEGTLGIVTQVRLKVRHAPQAVAHHLIYFPEMTRLFEAAMVLAAHEPRPYNLEFMDDDYLSLLKAAGYAAPQFARGSGVLLVTYDGQAGEIESASVNVAAVARQYGGTDTPGAEEHWRERFKILRVRRAVPDLLPSSVYVPTGSLPVIYVKLQRLKKHPLALLGYITSPGECSLMPLISVNTSRPLAYTFALHTPRDISNVAVSMGGRPGGGIGIWNAPYRTSILGKDRLAKARQLKRELDPENVLNPGMWTSPPPAFTPAVYQPAMALASAIDAVLPAPVSRDRAGFEQELAACVQCGYCMEYCPTKREWVSTTPRGRVLATRELFLGKLERPSLAPEYMNRLYQCTMCGRCGVDCSVDIKSRAMWLGTRKHLGMRGLGVESLRQLTALVDGQHNIAGRSNEQRAAWTSRAKLPFDLKAKRTAPVVYFVGCVASFYPMVQPSARAFVQLLNAAGVDFTIAGGEEWCCGFPLLAAGDVEATRRTFAHNLQKMREIGAQTIVTTCPGCYKTWKEEYHEVTEERHPFTILHSTEFLARLAEHKKLNLKPLQTRVTYHDPCDLGRNAGLYDEPRYLLKGIPGLELVEMQNNREYCTCCGSGGDLLASNQEMALAIAGRKLGEITATGAASAVTACPSCIRAISMAKTAAKARLDVLDISEVLWQAAGA